MEVIDASYQIEYDVYETIFNDTAYANTSVSQMRR